MSKEKTLYIAYRNLNRYYEKSIRMSGTTQINKNLMPPDRAIPPLGIHPKDSNSAHLHRDTSMYMFMTALNTIANLSSQARCL